MAVPDTTGATILTGTEYVVILLLTPLAALVPTLLVALTVNVYAVPAVKPVTVIVPEPAWLNVPVIPSGLLVAVYDVMAAPPLLAGAVNETVAVVVPVAVAVPIVGAPESSAVVTVKVLRIVRLSLAKIPSLTT